MLENSRRDFHTRKKCDCVCLRIGEAGGMWPQDFATNKEVPFYFSIMSPVS